MLTCEWMNDVTCEWMKDVTSEWMNDVTCEWTDDMACGQCTSESVTARSKVQVDRTEKVAETPD